MKHDYFELFLTGYTAMCLMTQAQLWVFPSQEVSVHISDKATETQVTSTGFFFLDWMWWIKKKNNDCCQKAQKKSPKKYCFLETKETQTQGTPKFYLCCVNKTYLWLLAPLPSCGASFVLSLFIYLGINQFSWVTETMISNTVCKSGKLQVLAMFF